MLNRLLRSIYARIDPARPSYWPYVHAIIGQAPSEVDCENLTWRSLEDYDGSVQAACASAGAVESLMKGWATRLKARFDALYGQSQDKASLKRIADFMLCAAIDRPLRWQAYLRYALTQEADRVRPTFETFTLPEFQNVSWHDFVKEFKTLGDVLTANGREGAALSPSPVTVRPKLQGIALRRPIPVVKAAA